MMFKWFALNNHTVLASLISLASVLCLWLAIQFSNTLLHLTASQLLEQEQAYLQAQLADNVLLLNEQTTDQTALIRLQYDGIHPSRPYFTMHSNNLAKDAISLVHNNAVMELPSDDDNAKYYAVILLPATPSEAPLWLKLDLNAAFPISEFLQLLQVFCAFLVAVLGGASLWLVFRLSKARQQLAAAMQHEQDFVNDISHELRTPLSIVQNALNLNGDSSFKGDALCVAKAATSAMAQQLHVLLALARNQQTPTEHLALLPQLEQAMFMLYQTEPAFVSQIQMDVPEDFMVNGHKQLIQLLLLNIISNACYHSGGAVLHIQLNGCSMHFINQIQRQPDGTVASNNRYQGFGHGNSLIGRIATALGWPVEIQHTETHYQLTISELIN
ncbi:histidine kinase dimerization/phospho-acceptor domain-containing protein [Rheinheimera baltica]|uniref:histidine kinase dimerization/phospho-acceptor domain-containing protein n=2 Tax=Rheinheimera baltica TaxID=67576 RepID=UPI00273EBA05|nr:histidine kinase dimerization/phospho-acceptor domain-containing protein [Rheinheimera baltica]MDP5151717.1 hypothetical protein [Rheinheimera baltica]